MLQSIRKNIMISSVNNNDENEEIDFDDLISAASAAEFMQIKTRSVYEYRRTGRITGRKFGRSWLISKRSIQDWMDKKREYRKNEDPS